MQEGNSDFASPPSGGRSSLRGRDVHRGIEHVLQQFEPGSGSRLEDPELWGQFHRMFHLLERIEQLVAGEANHSFESQWEPPPTHQAAQTFEQPDTRETGQFVSGRPSIYEPPSVEPLGSYADDPEDELAPDPVVDPESGHNDPDSGGIECWWINFSGDVSLDRLARLRRIVDESPFTIEARFDEVCDGLIVMRVLTENVLTIPQMDWIIRQVMDSVGIDRNTAILSRN